MLKKNGRREEKGENRWICLVGRRYERKMRIYYGGEKEMDKRKERRKDYVGGEG